MRTLILLLIFAGCQGGLSGKQEIVQSGSSTAYVTLRFEFIDQLRQLCSSLYLSTDYPSSALYQQQVSKCVFEHLGAAGVTGPQITNFQQQYCQNTPANLTPEQLVAIQSTCQVFSQSF